MGGILDRARRALRNASTKDAIAELDAEHQALEARRVLRAHRRAGHPPPRCGGCRRWLASTRERCSCGFRNDVRGARNHGGYA